MARVTVMFFNDGEMDKAEARLTFRNGIHAMGLYTSEFRHQDESSYVFLSRRPLTREEMDEYLNATLVMLCYGAPTDPRGYTRVSDTVYSWDVPSHETGPIVESYIND